MSTYFEFNLIYYINVVTGTLKVLKIKVQMLNNKIRIKIQ